MQSIYHNPLTQTNFTLNKHFLGVLSSMVLYPFCACSERANCLPLSREAAHPKNVTLELLLDTTLLPQYTKCKVDQMNGPLTSVHTEIPNYSWCHTSDDLQPVYSFYFYIFVLSFL